MSCMPSSPQKVNDLLVSGSRREAQSRGPGKTPRYGLVHTLRTKTQQPKGLIALLIAYTLLSSNCLLFRAARRSELHLLLLENVFQIFLQLVPWHLGR